MSKAFRAVFQRRGTTTNPLASLGRETVLRVRWRRPWAQSTSWPAYAESAQTWLIWGWEQRRRPGVGGVVITTGAAIVAARWALRGAITAAVTQATAAERAGLEQAHAAVEAALAQVRGTREQWRSNTRREAAVAFVLAAERQLDVARHIRSGGVPLDETTHTEITETHHAARHALAVVRLEGPEPLAAHASKALRAVNDVANEAVDMNPGAHASYVLQCAAADGIEAAVAALARLAEASGPDDPREAAAWAVLGKTGVLTEQQLQALRTSYLRRAERPNGPALAVDEQARKAIGMFIDAVRAHLDGDPLP
jgi:hypothetical protein